MLLINARFHIDSEVEINAATEDAYKAVLFKVEKIQEDSLDSISSPSVKIQIIGGKVYLSCKGKTLLCNVNKLFVFKTFVDKVIF